MEMDAADIIERLGGSKAVQALTGLTKGRISQWKTENHIPKSWKKFLQSIRPDVFVVDPTKRLRKQRVAA